MGAVRFRAAAPMAEPIPITVDSRLHLPHDQLSDELFKDLCSRFTYDNPKADEPGQPESIKSWQSYGGDLLLPRGGTKRVREVLHNHGQRWRFIDERTEGDPELRPGKLVHDLKLWDHQARTVAAIKVRENCLVRLPTGAGKTSAAIGLIVDLGLPTLVIVYQSALLEQWYERLRIELGLDAAEIGIVGGGEKSLRPITLAMQQTLHRMSDKTRRLFGPKWGVVICDEVARWAATTFEQTIDWLPARYRVGLSADERRRDGLAVIIRDHFGEVVAEVPHEQLADDGIVHDVEIRMHPTDFRADWYSQMCQKGRNVVNIAHNKLLAKLVADKDRNQLILGIIGDELDAGRQIVALSHRRGHCEAICNEVEGWGCPTGIMLGGASAAEETARTIEGLRSGEIKFAAGTLQAIGQGIDLPSVDRGIVMTPIANNKPQWTQVRGRFCRIAEGKDDAVMHYIYDQLIFGQKAVRNLGNWNRRCLVKENGEWVPAKEWLKARKVKR